MTDAGLQALAAAGCGTNLTSLVLMGECLRFFLAPPFLCPARAPNRADLREGVSDAGLQALVAAGCGTNLTSLTLLGACLFLVFFPPSSSKKRNEPRRAEGGRVGRRPAGAGGGGVRHQPDVAGSWG